LAPRRDSGGQELRRASAVDRPALRHRVFTRGTLARGLRHHRATGARRVLAPARLAAATGSGADAERLRIVGRLQLGAGASALARDLDLPPSARHEGFRDAVRVVDPAQTDGAPDRVAVGTGR